MSAVHRTAAYAAFTRKVRPIIEANLPAACIRCGGVIRPGDRWHVGHIIDDALGGELSMSNVGPEHARCNTSAGGKLGASIQAGRRSRAASFPKW
jgi:5-methylcytosine-specific restriction endonuclease McrA